MWKQVRIRQISELSGYELVGVHCNFVISSILDAYILYIPFVSETQIHTNNLMSFEIFGNTYKSFPVNSLRMFQKRFR